MASPWIAFAIVINGVLFGTAIVLISYLWRERGNGGNGEDAESIEAWYVEAGSLAREVQEVIEQSEAIVDTDNVQRRILPLSARLKGHARSAPGGVDDRLVTDLHKLGVNCSRTGMERSMSDAAHPFLVPENRFQDLRMTAEEFQQRVEAQSRP